MNVADKKRLNTARRRADNARKRLNGGYVVTCPASRHLHIMADALAKGRPYPMFTEEPQHCAESILAVLASLWELRSKSPDYARAIDKALARINQRNPLVQGVDRA